MRVFLIRDQKGIRAQGEYDIETKKMTVLAGSVVSDSVAKTAKFRGAKSIEKSRDGVLKGGVLQRDIAFTSASTAANFVTGTSTNGLTAWKNEKGVSIKEMLSGV